MSILEELWYGNIEPAEYDISPDKKYKEETAMTYGYIRVSTKEQNEDRQRIALMDIGVPEKNIILDK